jgi:indolepyruvate ferredoxin oxidoreductase
VKRRIDQASCNKDFSCLNGFCPSFNTVLGAEPRKGNTTRLEPSSFDNLPVPTPRLMDESGFAAMITGIGGTGVVTVAAILGMAAHIEGYATSLFDMTGLAQKNGAVFSHVRIARRQEDLRTQRVGRGEADVILAFDVVAALADEARQTIKAGRTVAVANSDVTPTVAFQFNMNATVDGSVLTRQLGKVLGEEATIIIDAVALASKLLGNPIGANLLLVGIAVQRGLLPVSVAALEEAVRLNGAAVELNLTALRLGRALAADAARVRALLPPAPEPLDQALDALVARRLTHLTAYQDKALAERYRSLVARVQRAERELGTGSEALSRAVAENYARVLAYKDEYEVARLLTDPALSRELQTTFANGARYRYNLAPAILTGFKSRGRPRKWGIPRFWLFPALSLLARAKRLRGSAFDLFGYSRERRQERALIHQYEMLTEDVLRRLMPDNLVAAAELLSLVGIVRGFGPVKSEALRAYLKTVEARWQVFASSAPDQQSLGRRATIA